ATPVRRRPCENARPKAGPPNAGPPHDWSRTAPTTGSWTRPTPASCCACSPRPWKRAAAPSWANCRPPAPTEAPPCAWCPANTEAPYAPAEATSTCRAFAWNSWSERASDGPPTRTRTGRGPRRPGYLPAGRTPSPHLRPDHRHPAPTGDPRTGTALGRPDDRGPTFPVRPHPHRHHRPRPTGARTRRTRPHTAPRLLPQGQTLRPAPHGLPVSDPGEFPTLLDRDQPRCPGPPLHPHRQRRARPGIRPHRLHPQARPGRCRTLAAGPGRPPPVRRLPGGLGPRQRPGLRPLRHRPRDLRDPLSARPTRTTPGQRHRPAQRS